MIIIHDLEFEYHYKLIDMVLERPESTMRSCTLAMLVEPVELYVRDFHDILKLKLTGKIDSDISRILVEILLGLTNDDARKFKETYEQLFESSVKNDIEIVQGETSIISKLLIQLLEGKRYDESNSSATIAKTIAKKLYEATEDTPAIDYDTFIRIFTRDSFSQLSTIFDIYEDKYGRPIQEAIERQFQGQLETQCFQDIIEFTRSPNRYYSKLLRQALEKTPVDYRTLIRIIIGHEDKDLGEIVLEYSKSYDESLDETVKNHVDIAEIKRLFVLIITKGEDIAVNDGGQVRFDHVNNSSSAGSGINLPTTSGAYATGRRLSHEAFDKFVNAFKTIRPH
jgi:hypothetical protein